MTAAAALKSIVSSLVPSRRVRRSQEAGHGAAHDKHLPDALDDSLPPLRPVTFPKVLPYHQPALNDQGWSTVTYDTPADKLFSSSQALLEASKAFFDLPAPYKETFKTQIGSEEGWSHVEGEKEFITLRSLDHTPKELRDAVSIFWAEAGGLLDELLARIAESLGLPADALTVYSTPCKQLLPERTASMLRLFKYEGFEGRQSKTVAESHRDLGLLSLVIGDTPGLEVWDRNVQKWFQIERSYSQPAGSLLVGRQLERLSNGRYRAGGHLVRSYPDPPSRPHAEQSIESARPERTYRYSIVFILRAHSPVPINTDNLTTPITGPFRHPLRDITARELFRDIRSAHFNINTGLQERDEQKRKLAEKKNQSPSPVRTDQDEKLNER